MSNKFGADDFMANNLDGSSDVCLHRNLACRDKRWERRGEVKESLGSNFHNQQKTFAQIPTTFITGRHCNFFRRTLRQIHPNIAQMT